MELVRANPIFIAGMSALFKTRVLTYLVCDKFSQHSLQAQHAHHSANFFSSRYRCIESNSHIHYLLDLEGTSYLSDTEG